MANSKRKMRRQFESIILSFWEYFFFWVYSPCMSALVENKTQRGEVRFPRTWNSFFTESMAFFI